MSIFTKPKAAEPVVIPPTLDEALEKRANELRRTESDKQANAEWHAREAEKAAVIASDAAAAATAVEKAFAVVVEAEQKAYAILAEADVAL